MIACNDCHSSGMVACPKCSGIGYVREVRLSGDLQYRACTVCDGKKWVRCDSCSGIGWLGADGDSCRVDEHEEFDHEPAEDTWECTARDQKTIERLVRVDW